MSPCAEHRTTKLCPDVHQAIVLGWSLTTGHLDPLDQRALEVDLAGMGEGELHDRADVRVDRRRTGWSPVNDGLRIMFCNRYG